jgi:hypothetical protein
LRRGEVDVGATQALRAERRGSAPAPLFDLGPSRRSYESVWTEEFSTALARFLFDLPPPFRAYAKRQLHRRIDQWDRDAPPSPEVIPALWAEIVATMGGMQ